VFAPICCPNGTHAFGRDPASSNAVWSPEEGYPGDFSYREFYRDIGFDMPIDYIGPHIHNRELRVQTGFKYFAITGKTGEKRSYRPEEALIKVEEHAENFLYNREKQIKKLSQLMDRPPVIICPFDAELFGHWWYEGPRWLDKVIRKIGKEHESITLSTPTDYLDQYPDNQRSVPSLSSWGNKGYSEVWLNGNTDWIYRHVHKAIERMVELAERFPNEKGLKERALNQAAREVLLSQASDWPFIIRTGTTIPYAIKRVEEHICNFTTIYDNLCRNTVNTEWLTGVEKKNNILPDIDYRLFAKKSTVSRI
jgi:1,4-alpha-glucan branching enzyme